MNIKLNSLVIAKMLTDDKRGSSDRCNAAKSAIELGYINDNSSEFMEEAKVAIKALNVFLNGLIGVELSDIMLDLTQPLKQPAYPLIHRTYKLTYNPKEDNLFDKIYYDVVGLKIQEHFTKIRRNKSYSKLKYIPDVPYFKVHSIEEVKTASTKTKSFKVDVSLIDLRPIMVKNDNQR